MGVATVVVTAAWLVCRDVRRAAVEGALAVGAIPERERDMRARLQDQLGLSGTEARAIEREVRGARGVG